MLTFSHKFQDGAVVTLSVNLSADTPRMHATFVHPDNYSEYVIWRDRVVAPDIAARLTPSQLAAIARAARRKLNARGGYEIPKR